jgi:hypothetical protein
VRAIEIVQQVSLSAVELYDDGAFLSRALFSQSEHFCRRSLLDQRLLLVLAGNLVKGAHGGGLPGLPAWLQDEIDEGFCGFCHPRAEFSTFRFWFPDTSLHGCICGHGCQRENPEEALLFEPSSMACYVLPSSDCWLGFGGGTPRAARKRQRLREHLW